MTLPSPAAQWEDRYATTDYIYGTEPNDFLAAEVARLPKGPVLCIADGEGRNSVWLAQQGFTVTSIDLSPSAVRKAQALAQQRGVGVDAHVADASTFDLGTATWSAVVSVFAHMPPAVRSDLHRRVVDALAPGGVLLLEAYTPDQVGRGTGGPQDPALCMTLETLRSELRGLNETFAATLVRPVIEGPLHSGDGSVVQYIATKTH